MKTLKNILFEIENTEPSFNYKLVQAKTSKNSHTLAMAKIAKQTKFPKFVNAFNGIEAIHLIYKYMPTDLKKNTFYII